MQKVKPYFSQYQPFSWGLKSQYSPIVFGGRLSLVGVVKKESIENMYFNLP